MSEHNGGDILVFAAIDKSYGDTVALRDVSFEVAAGEIFGLLGPNGAGKTSLIRILMDIIRANSGSITLFGEPHSRTHLDRLGYLPEERGLYVKHKVLDVMVYFGMLKGMARAEARLQSRSWLQRVGLPDVASWKVERLSKGMTQKVQIAATLLSEPELCVLDEPFTGLDPVNVRLVQRLIEERRDAGLTTILSTHRMNMVEALCDRVGLINRGELLAYGTVHELRHAHSRPEVEIDAAGPLPTVPGVVRIEGEGNPWRLTLEPGVRPSAILAALVSEGTEIDRFEQVLASMEEVFVNLVGERAA